jgi:hypothetical protein
VRLRRHLHLQGHQVVVSAQYHLPQGCDFLHLTTAQPIMVAD